MDEATNDTLYVLDVLLAQSRVLLHARVVGWSTLAKHGSKTNLPVDLLHALEIGLRCALGAEDDVLHIESAKIARILEQLRLRLTISSRVRRLVSGTKNQMNAAPKVVRIPKMMYVP